MTDERISEPCGPHGRRNARWLDLRNDPYSIVGAPWSGAPRKRYLHAPAHDETSATGLLKAVCEASDIGFAETPASRLWSRLEGGVPRAFSAGAIQIGADDVARAKAYLKPMRTEGVGLRLPAMALGHAIDQMHPGMGGAVRREILRRDGIDEIFYVAVAMRPELEIETYHDIEFRRTAYLADDVRRIACGLAMHQDIAEQARRCVAAVSGLPLACNHVSCDLWPIGSGGVTVVISPVSGDTGHPADHYEAVRRIMDLPGALGTGPAAPPDMTLVEGMVPSVVAVKIAPHDGEVRHAVFVEEVDPAFAELL